MVFVAIPRIIWLLRPVSAGGGPAQSSPPAAPSFRVREEVTRRIDGEPQVSDGDLAAP